MNAQLTQVHAQQHIGDLQRQADHARLAAATDAEPATSAEPRRASARRRWLVLTLVTDRRRA